MANSMLPIPDSGRPPLRLAQPPKSMICKRLRPPATREGEGEKAKGKGAKCDTLMVWRLVKNLACHLSGNNNEWQGGHSKTKRQSVRGVWPWGTGEGEG